MGGGRSSVCVGGGNTVRRRSVRSVRPCTCTCVGVCCHVLWGVRIDSSPLSLWAWN